jgi:hypothetical protein
MNQAGCRAQRRMAIAVAGFLSLCFSFVRAGDRAPGIFSPLNDSLLRLPSLTLSDAQFFSFASAFNRMEPTTPDLLPAVALPTTVPQHRVAYVPPGTDSKDSSKEASDVSRRNLLDYVHGEVGFLYGRSTGKFSGNTEQAYIIGDVGDDKFHITAGAAYENSSIRISRH